MSNPNVHLAIKAYFYEKGISVREVAEKMNTHPVYISNVLNGRKGIGRNTAAKLSELWGFNVSWLMTGEGEMFRESATCDLASLLKLVKQQEMDIAVLQKKYLNLLHEVEAIKDCSTKAKR